ncbi:ATP-binding protein [Candidatus Altiarchaeota archaeon]
MPEGHVKSFDKEFLQSIIDGIEESIVVLDPEYRITCYNKAFLGWMKKTKKNILGEFCYSVIHDHGVRCRPCIVRETFRTGQSFEASHDHEIGKDSKVFHESKSYPIKDDNDKVEYVIYMFRDITERAAIEEKVRELNKFKKKILDNAGVAINILDKDGSVMNSNKGAEELFGYDEGFVKGESHSIFYRKDDQELLASTRQDALENGKFNGEVTLIKKNKTEFPAHLTLTTVDDDNGVPVAFIEIINDLTQIKKAESLIKKQLEKLKELDTLKEEYFYSTSHEFKTPLTTIVGLTRMLLDEKIGGLTKQQMEALELVYCDAKRLRGAVQKILDIAKIESGKMVYHIEELDIEPIIDEVVETLNVLISAKGLKIRKDINNLHKINADKDRLMLVIENLVNNAIKFTPPKGDIFIKGSKDKNNILIEIQDTGVGIPDEDTRKVFEKYYQVKSGLGENVGGSGLGLVICKQIIEAFKGKIWCESSLGVGSTFKFTLPYKKKKAKRKKGSK